MQVWHLARRARQTTGGRAALPDLPWRGAAKRHRLFVLPRAADAQGMSALFCARLFLGTNFCSHCGADAAELAPHAGSHQPRFVSRCVTPRLAPRLVGACCLEQCDCCHGIFVDRSAIEQILQDRERARADADLGRAAARRCAGTDRATGRQALHPLPGLQNHDEPHAVRRWGAHHRRRLPHPRHVV